MTSFYKKNTTVECSQFNEHGYFIKNTTEFVSKGTALGPEFTTNIYQPKEGVVGKYNKATDTWEDIKSNLGRIFYSSDGKQFIIDTVDGKFPEWAVTDTPPEYAKDSQTVLHKDGIWKVYEIQIGAKYYDDDGNELTISDINFDLPDKHTFTPPPEHNKDNGETVKFSDGKWVIYTRCAAYLKADCNQGAEFTDKSLIPQGYTLTKPATQFDEWIKGEWVTNLSSKYIHDYGLVNDTRRTLYTQNVDPLEIEASRLRRHNKIEEAKTLESQADNLVAKIKKDNPWPENPNSTN